MGNYERNLLKRPWESLTPAQQQRAAAYRAHKEAEAKTVPAIGHNGGPTLELKIHPETKREYEIWRDGYSAGKFNGEHAHMKGDALAFAYAQLEIQNEKLKAKLYGYVNRMASEPPGNPKGEPRKGRVWRKIRHRVPYQLNPDGTWRRVKGQ